MRAGATSLVVLLSSALVACGSSPPPTTTAADEAAPETSLRALTEREEAAVRVAVAAMHGEGAEVLHAEAAGRPSRVLAIYAHTDVASVPSASDRVCGASAEPAVVALRDPACRYLAIGRLAPDGSTLDARLELGAWCPDDQGTFELYADDFDHDGRDEVSLMVGELASYVLDVTTFGVQFAGPGTEYQLLHPNGTGLVRPVDPSLASPGSEASGYTPYEFEDSLDEPVMQIGFCSGEPLRLRRASDARHVPLELLPYDASADCWRPPAPN